MIALFLAVAALLGVVVLLGISWRRPISSRTPTMPRKPWLLLAALVPQLAWTSWISHLGDGASTFVWLLPVSYLPVLWFIALNFHYPWARVIALGVTLNLAVMLGNGGTMPMPARFVANQPALTVASFDPGSKDRVVADGQATLLAPLEDQYVVTLPGGSRRLASIGDFVSLGGAVFGLLSSL